MLLEGSKCLEGGKCYDIYVNGAIMVLLHGCCNEI